jgi:hypothetical protein
MNLSNDPGLSYFPRIATDGNNSVYVVWTDNSPGNYNILFTKSVDGGASFDKPIIVSNLNGVSNFPSIIASGNNSVYVVWSHKNNTDFDPSNTENQTQTYDVFFTKSLDQGNTFSKVSVISSNIARSISPSISTVGNNIYLVLE